MENSVNSAPPIKPNDFQRLWSETGPAVLDAVQALGQSGWYILGPEVSAFEADLAAFWQRSHCVGVANGLDAIAIGLKSMGLKRGDKVLVPPVSAFATVLAVIQLGGVPVFVDCDAYGLIDLDQAEAALAADSSLRYMVPVHLYGHCLDMHRLAALRDRYGVRILEDCAQSIEASFEGIPCGSAGECLATSFYPTKNLGAFGDAGALLTNDSSLDTHARSLRDYGQSAKYRHEFIGYNSRLDELHAAILRRVLLPRLRDWTASRRRIASAYLDGIANPRVCPLGQPQGSLSCWHLFPVTVPQPQKASFLQHLKNHSVGAGEHYPGTLMDQPAMREVQHIQIGDLARSRQLCLTEVSLPIHPYLSEDEVGRVIAAVNSWT